MPANVLLTRRSRIAERSGRIDLTSARVITDGVRRGRQVSHCFQSPAESWAAVQRSRSTRRREHWLRIACTRSQAVVLHIFVLRSLGNCLASDHAEFLPATALGVEVLLGELTPVGYRKKG